MTNEQAWLYAATWGSYMNSGDPGACMYGFDENFTIQHETHRATCLDWIDNHCVPQVQAHPEDYDDNELEQLAKLRTKIAAKNLEIPKLDDFTAAYIETALWCGVEPAEHDANDKNYDRSIEELAPEALGRMIADCLDFQHKHGAIIDAAIETGEVVCGPDFDEYGRAGHDFWLTRNGHGAGFWDGDWPEPYASKLDEAATSFGECDLYLDDDGKVYIA